MKILELTEIEQFAVIVWAMMSRGETYDFNTNKELIKGLHDELTATIALAGVPNHDEKKHEVLFERVKSISKELAFAINTTENHVLEAVQTYQDWKLGTGNPVTREQVGFIEEYGYEANVQAAIPLIGLKVGIRA